MTHDDFEEAMALIGMSCVAPLNEFSRNYVQKRISPLYERLHLVMAELDEAKDAAPISEKSDE